MDASKVSGIQEDQARVGDRPALGVGEAMLTLATKARLLAAVVLVVGIGAAVLLRMLDNQYQATVGFVPEVRSEGLPAQLATLAAIARVGVPASQQSQSPQFYSSVLVSRPIRYAVLTQRYSADGVVDLPSGADSAPLVDLLRAKGRSTAERLWNGARTLGKRTNVTYDLRTAIVRVSVEMPSATLAAAVANGYATELDRFNREVRRSQARARRQFIENSLQQISADLAAAETAAKNFLAHNRRYQESPTLQFEFNRLQRALTVQQELYLDLRRQLDAAKIAEVNDLPVISVIEPAIPPQRKSGPPRLKWLAAILIFAIVATSAYVIVRAHHERLFPGLGPSLSLVATQLRRGFIPKRRVT